MPLFSYTAVNQEGVLIRGVVEGSDPDQASESITSSGLYVIEVRKAVSYIASLRKRLLAPRIKRVAVIEFANNLSVMLRAGVPLLNALTDIAETTEEKYFRDIIFEIRNMVSFGSSFSDALDQQKNIFPNILIRLVRTGEETGSLDNTLSEVAGHLQRIEDLVAAVKRAFVYPAFALVTTGGALIFWLVFVLPRVLVAFTEMGVELPLATQILLAISNFISTYWYIFLIAPVCMLLIIRILKKQRKTSYYVDRTKLHIPVFKHIIYNRLLALFCEQLRILIVAGITIDRALTITADVIGNEVFRVAIEDIVKEVTAGNKISDSMRKHGVFPPMLVRMVDVGESSGVLDEQFVFLSQYFLKRLDDISEKIGKVLEPMIIGVIGVVFLFVIVSLLFPVYDLVIQIGE